MSEAKSPFLPGLERYVRTQAYVPFDLYELWRALECEFVAPYVGVAMNGLRRLCRQVGEDSRPVGASDARIASDASARETDEGWF